MLSLGISSLVLLSMVEGFTQFADDLVAVLGAVLLARNVDPIVATVGGLHDGLVKICVGDDPLKPLLCQVHVGVTLVVVPVAVVVQRDVDVSCFAHGVLTCVCSTYFDIQLRATIARADDDGLLSELAERLEDGLTQLFGTSSNG